MNHLLMVKGSKVERSFFFFSYFWGQHGLITYRGSAESSSLLFNRSVTTHKNWSCISQQSFDNHVMILLRNIICTRLYDVIRKQSKGCMCHPQGKLARLNLQPGIGGLRVCIMSSLCLYTVYFMKKIIKGGIDIRQQDIKIANIALLDIIQTTEKYLQLPRSNIIYMVSGY